MALAYLFDHNVHHAIARGLRRRGVDVLTAYEDGSHRIEDHELLARATELGRVLFTTDNDLFREAHQRQVAGLDFSGVVYVHQNRLPIGRVIDDLEILAEASVGNEASNRVIVLPL